MHVPPHDQSPRLLPCLPRCYQYDHMGTQCMEKNIVPESVEQGPRIAFFRYLDPRKHSNVLPNSRVGPARPRRVRCLANGPSTCSASRSVPIFLRYVIEISNKFVSISYKPDRKSLKGYLNEFFYSSRPRRSTFGEELHEGIVSLLEFRICALADKKTRNK